MQNFKLSEHVYFDKIRLLFQ